MNICIIGTGYVGLVTGACLAKIGHEVICYDIDKNKIDLLCTTNLPFFEPGLEELIKDCLHSNTLMFCGDLKSAVDNSQLIIIAVGTPCSKNGEADISQVESVSKQLACMIKDYKVISIKSTVPVGTCSYIENLIRKNLSSNCQLDVVSNPEFLREGSAIFDMCNADRIIIGSNSEKASRIMEEVYLPFGRTILLTARESAELIKYISNAFLATKISFINEVANFCEVVGGDIRDIANGVGLDSRIGPNFLNPGVGFGGSCFPKDIKALISTAKKNNFKFRIVDSTLKINNIQKKIPVQKLRQVLGNLNGKTIALWGLSFKPNTDDIREAPSLDIIKDLLKEGVILKAFDPVSMDKVKEKYPQILYAKDCYEATTGASAIVLITEWSEFEEINMCKVKNLMIEPVIIDGRNFLDGQELKELGFKYMGIGIN